MLSRVIVFSLLLFGGSAAPSNAQMPTADQTAPVAAPSSRLRVYLDCSDCFQDYVRDEIRWVDFVRQPQDAQVQVLTSNSQTGSGGREVVVRFVGLGRFDGVTQELRAATEPGATEDVRRRAFVRTLSVGLIGFMAREGLPAGFDVNVEAAENGPRVPERDPWNLWVFSVGADGTFESEESNRQSSWEFDATADRVTDHWKMSFGVNLEEETETFDLDEDDPFEVRRTDRRVDWFFAKSLGEHWSLGLEGDFRRSTFGNIKLQTEVAPAIEFNAFPYSQYASRQLRIAYSAGISRSQYNEVTLFDKTKETLGEQRVTVDFDQREPWGTLNAGIEWSQYFHDLSLNRLEFDGQISVRIIRGLSVELRGNASRIRDQLSLPRRDATQEEVLLRLRELQSGHEVFVSVGVSYSFGSIFNNIVNPRFGQGGGGGN